MSVIVIYAVAWVFFEDIDLGDIDRLKLGIAILLSLLSLWVWMILKPL